MIQNKQYENILHNSRTYMLQKEEDMYKVLLKINKNTN